MNHLNKAFNKEQARAIEKYVAEALEKLNRAIPEVDKPYEAGAAVVPKQPKIAKTKAIEEAITSKDVEVFEQDYSNLAEAQAKAE